MSKGFLIAFAAGLLITAIVIGGVFYARQGKHLVPRGSVLKVRTQAIDDNNSLAVLEIRLVNDSDENMVVRDIEAIVQTKDGQNLPGAAVAASDAKTIFKYYPQLGEQFNEPLKEQDRVLAHQTVDRMLVARFQASGATMQDRKKITVRVTDEGGAVAEFSSEPH